MEKTSKPNKLAEGLLFLLIMAVVVYLLFFALPSVLGSDDEEGYTGDADNQPDKEPFCRCLYEIEHNLPRSQFCFAPCKEQKQILAARKRQANGAVNEDQCKRAYQAQKKIKKKLMAMLLAGKVNGFGVRFDHPSGDKKCFIHVRVESLTPDITSQFPKTIDGVDVILEQGGMAKAL